MAVDVQGIKSQVAEAIRTKNGQQTGAVVRSGSFGADVPPSFPIVPIVFGGAVLISAGLFFALRPNQAVQQTATGQAQIDLAMQMLANQQNINERLQQGQQELSAQIIQSQKDAQPTHTTVNCFLTRYCPGSVPNASGGDYAVIGESIQTARVNPNQALQPEQPQQQVQPPNQPDPNAYPDPVQSVQYTPQQAWADFYSDMRMNDWQRLTDHRKQCAAAGWSTVNSKINCYALAEELKK